MILNLISGTMDRPTREKKKKKNDEETPENPRKRAGRKRDIDESEKMIDGILMLRSEALELGKSVN